MVKVKLIGKFERSESIPSISAAACTSDELSCCLPKNHDVLSKRTLESGHHTVFQNARFLFAIEGVTRHAIWSFLHAHPYYNSSQQSQRYVRVRPGNVRHPSNKRAEFIVSKQFDVYSSLCEKLGPLVEERFRAEGRKANKQKIVGCAQETARYVLPVGVQTHLVHEIDGATLFRYALTHKLCDVPKEAGEITAAMLATVGEFAKDLGPAMEVSREDVFFHEDASNTANMKEFDDEVDEFGGTKLIESFDIGEDIARLYGWADEPYSWLGIEGIPPFNFQVAHMTKYDRTLHGPCAAFKKRLSHTADSQAQRHRTVPNIVPPIQRSTNLYVPDYITPKLITVDPAIHKLYDDHMEMVWEEAGKMLGSLEDEREAYYVLPNAMTIRKITSSSMFGFAHMMRMRLCARAQHEIWELARSEYSQLRDVFPWIVGKVGPACEIRGHNGIRPACPEKGSTCGLRKWDDDIMSIERVF